MTEPLSLRLEVSCSPIARSRSGRSRIDTWMGWTTLLPHFATTAGSV